ncbi:uncharacterized protein B0T15DRAFT_320928 [Chaetomium strumarium]|uniref:AAA+ ATPase domain-containing protein n=1 Tax=Chaetomium strumarium TaxID=1170767 RepID=A0AAJ0GKM4_9PEZI|nr:hypothetical protein B0T15DRAFT_320928 [Chaetomium strumarium]
MGPLAVLTMAGTSMPTDTTAQRPLHPFFTQSRSTVPMADNQALNDSSAPAEPDNPSTAPDATGSERSEEDVPEPATTRGRRRKADKELREETQKKARPRKRARNLPAGSIEGHFLKLGKGSGSAADKPNSTEGSADIDVSAPKEAVAVNFPNAAKGVNHGGLDLATGDTGVEHSAHNDLHETKNHGCVPESTTTASTEAVAGTAKPKKLLQFNPKTGTIGSPPKPKLSKTATDEAHDVEKKPPAKRGRKPTSKIVQITYGPDPNARVRLGELIDAILSGQARHSVANSKQIRPTSSREQSLDPLKSSAPRAAKTTHPFFLGQTKKSELTAEDPKPKKSASSPPSSRTKQYSSTPCSPRKSRIESAAKVPMPQFGVKNLGLKFPGAKLPPWPWHDVAHTRGDGHIALLADTDTTSLPLASRKSKGNAVKVPPNESVVSLATKSAEFPAMVKAVQNINTEEIIPPPPELRLPQKHFESGSKLQARILPELKTFQPTPLSKRANPLEKDVQGGERGVRAPSQLARLFGSIASSLSAFDTAQCETSNWVQKYAPASAIEVLQPGQEAFMLRDWLRALMVQSVDTGSTESEKPKAGSKAKGAGAGKKKRRKKLDGFIVSSEDEEDELYELSDEDDNWAPSGWRGILRKTVVQSGSLSRGRDADKSANTLVISGPHGCGKTAAVYAVAKELDFEVFEINPSSRRSGKDVLEKIGDMTRNHHVQQHQSASPPDDQDTAAEDDTTKDIKSGKQPTMSAFFKPKSGKPKPKQLTKTSAKAQPSSEVKKEAAKTQRQSLILLEEVDILYEEDKQFWSTVLGLISQSKRPFIMTCNDETLVPLNTLRLHGIFRLSPPPTDLAVDRLILIAANEGHALTRDSVEQLYESRNRDLRAATMDLQYWCQIGVGDRRGGFDWFYPRWPKGVDLDENNEVVRVISQDTYQPGMNLLGRDRLSDPQLSPRLVEEEVLHQAWESWGLDIGHWQDSTGLDSWAEHIRPEVTTPADRLGVLEAYDSLAEAMSAADVCSSKAFAAFKEEAIDTTQPEVPAKLQEDFVLGLTYLDTPPIVRFNSLTTSLASAIRSLAKHCLRLHVENLQKHSGPALRPLDEAQAIEHLQTSFTSALPDASAINRMDFALAFDPIATPDTSAPQPVSFLDPSVFDRTLRLIALDVAPYVRSIVAYDSKLQEQRLKLSSLMSEGGRRSHGAKRMRTTRSALSALEGGSRTTTRGEKWFKANINPYLVAKTAGKGWDASQSQAEETIEKSQRNSPKSTPTSTTPSPVASPTRTPRKKALKRKKLKKVAQDDDEETDELGC